MEGALVGPPLQKFGPDDPYEKLTAPTRGYVMLEEVFVVIALGIG
jgi:hypothetical protein